MSMTIHQNGQNTYTVWVACRYRIFTTVTSSGDDVERWINSIYGLHNLRCRKNELLIGLDAEWRPYYGNAPPNPVAVLQLCIGRRCLLFQIIHADHVPESLKILLAERPVTFCGVAVRADAARLRANYGLTVEGELQDLRVLAAERMANPTLQYFGLKALAKEVLGLDIDMSKDVTLSTWDQQTLTEDQIKYACVDAFVSFEIARKLSPSIDSDYYNL